MGVKVEEKLYYANFGNAKLRFRKIADKKPNTNRVNYVYHHLSVFYVSRN